MSASAINPAFLEVADWNLFDANVRLGPSGIHGELALGAGDLVREMDRFGIQRALVSHFACDEYDAEEGNNALAADLHERFVPVWAALPEPSFLEKLAARKPVAVRLSYGALKHNFSSAPWCSGELYEYLQDKSVLTIIAREDLASLPAGEVRTEEIDKGGAVQAQYEILVHIVDRNPRLPGRHRTIEESRKRGQILLTAERSPVGDVAREHFAEESTFTHSSHWHAMSQINPVLGVDTPNYDAGFSQPQGVRGFIEPSYGHLISARQRQSDDL